MRAAIVVEHTPYNNERSLVIVRKTDEYLYGEDDEDTFDMEHDFDFAQEGYREVTRYFFKEELLILSRR